MKYLLGTIFSIGMAVYVVVQHKKKGIITALVCILASIIFFGQFIAGLQ